MLQNDTFKRKCLKLRINCSLRKPPQLQISHQKRQNQFKSLKKEMEVYLNRNDPVPADLASKMFSFIEKMQAHQPRAVVKKKEQKVFAQTANLQNQHQSFFNPKMNATSMNKQENTFKQKQNLRLSQKCENSNKGQVEDDSFLYEELKKPHSMNRISMINNFKIKIKQIQSEKVKALRKVTQLQQKIEQFKTRKQPIQCIFNLNIEGEKPKKFKSDRIIETVQDEQDANEKIENNFYAQQSNLFKHIIISQTAEIESLRRNLVQKQDGFMRSHKRF